MVSADGASFGIDMYIRLVRLDHEYDLFLCYCKVVLVQCSNIVNADDQISHIEFYSTVQYSFDSVAMD